MLRTLTHVAKKQSVIGQAKSIFPLVKNVQDNKIQKRQFGSITDPSVLNVLTNSAVTTGQITGGFVGTTGILAATFLALRYKVAGPSEYLVRTGIFISDIDVSKRAFWLPYQTMTKVNLEPTTYHCVIEEAMSQERISFNMPTVFTIGPKDDKECIKNYAKLLQNASSDDLRSKIIGIIQGETRVAAGKIRLDDLFNDRDSFKETLVKSVDSELEQFGLKVYNANIEELRDMKGNEYFVFLRKRALEGAVNKAKVDVAEQNKIGNVGEKGHVTETRQKVAEFEKQAKLAENERDKEVAESTTKLEIVKAELLKQKTIAESESRAGAEKRSLELQQEVEQYRNKQEIERLRATQMSEANVQAEVNVRNAQGIADSLKLEAEGRANAVKIQAAADAEAIKMRASAEAESMKMKAVAHFVEKDNEAKGILELRHAEAEGLSKLIASAGSVDGLTKYLMVRDDILTEIAKAQSDGVKGMQPRITVWNTTSDKNEGSNSLSNTVADLVKTSVPFFENLKNTTGLDVFKNFRQNREDVITHKKPDNNL